VGAIEERALLHHTLGDGNFVNMLSSHRDFSAAQTRLEPANARWEIDRVPEELLDREATRLSAAAVRGSSN
jgi:TPP-dependent 2-oxoacid decarboxylase